MNIFGNLFKKLGRVVLPGTKEEISIEEHIIGSLELYERWVRHYITQTGLYETDFSSIIRSLSRIVYKLDQLEGLEAREPRRKAEFKEMQEIANAKRFIKASIALCQPCEEWFKAGKLKILSRQAKMINSKIDEAILELRKLTTMELMLG